MNKKKYTNIFIIIIALLLIGTAGYFVLAKKTIQITNNSNPIENLPITPETLEYVNTQYSFSFLLPISWKGYSIVDGSWEGNMIGVKTGGSIKGPEILIRHPLWIKEVPRQDIPIMIFTLSEWDLIQKEKLSLGAAPIPPSELGRNANYIFALPARYNFAFPAGFEEVQQIIEDKSFRAS